MVFSPYPGTVGSSPGLTQPAIFTPTFYMNGPVWNAEVFLQVTANGGDLPNVLSASVSVGHDITVATATVTLTEDPGISQNSQISIIAGTGPHNLQRFQGLLKRTRASLWPHSFTLICRGQLTLAEEFRQSTGAALPSFINQRLPIVGLSLFDIMTQTVDITDANAIAAGVQLLVSSDENYVASVLSRVPGLSFDPANIRGTGHIFGTLAWRELSWPPYVSALAQCQKLDEVCLGYKLFETYDGSGSWQIVRSQIFGYPTTDADFTLTEGVDVLTATGDRSIEDLLNAEYVEGYALGGKPGIINATAVESNSFQSSDQPFYDTFSSSLIEDDVFAALVRDWRLTERNRELVDIEMLTFRDDLFIPGHVVAVNLPHANVTEPVWVQHVDLTVRARPASFRQTVRGLGGGLP